MRPVGQKEFGTRREIKNLNSFRFLQQAIDYEVQWQINEIEDGRKIVQATVLFDPDTGETRAMRTKEDAHDYRYFPDPDLMPLEIDADVGRAACTRRPARAAGGDAGTLRLAVRPLRATTRARSRPPSPSPPTSEAVVTRRPAWRSAKTGGQLADGRRGVATEPRSAWPSTIRPGFRPAQLAELLAAHRRRHGVQQHRPRRTSSRRCGPAKATGEADADRDHRRQGPQADVRHRRNSRRSSTRCWPPTPKSVDEFRAGKEKALQRPGRPGHEGHQGQGQPGSRSTSF